MIFYIATNRLLGLLLRCLLELLAAVSVVPLPGRLEIKIKGGWDYGTKGLRSFNIELKICHGVG
jgi:hypothetical protein